MQLYQRRNSLYWMKTELHVYPTGVYFRKRKQDFSLPKVLLILYGREGEVDILLFSHIP